MSVLWIRVVWGQIKRIENWKATVEKKFVENAAAFGVQADNLAVDDCVLHLQLGQVVLQILENFYTDFAWARPTRTFHSTRVPVL